MTALWAPGLPVRTRKPPRGATVDWSHPLSQGLSGAFLLNEGGGLTVRNLARRAAGTFAGGTTWSRGPRGSVADFDATDDRIDLGSSTTLLTAGRPFTLAWWEQVKSGTGSFGSRFRLPIAGNSESFAVLRSDQVGYRYLSWGRANTGTNRNVASAAAGSLASSVGLWKHFAIVGFGGPETYPGPTGFAFYLNGVAETIDGNTTIYGSLGSTIARIGYDGADNGANCLMDAVLIWNGRALRGAEVQRLYREPYAVFAEPWRRVVQVSAPPAGGLSIPVAMATYRRRRAA